MKDCLNSTLMLIHMYANFPSHLSDPFVPCMFDCFEIKILRIYNLEASIEKRKT